MDQFSKQEQASDPPDPEYLAQRKLSESIDEACRNVNPGLAFKGFPFGDRPMLETPSQKAIDEYRRQILARYGL
jgi:hypothetical protein